MAKHKSKPQVKAPRIGPARITGIGVIARFSPVQGVTPKSALDQKIWLPAVLNTITIDETALHNEYDTLSAGHFSMEQMGPSSARQFRTSSLDSLTVDFDAPFLVATNQDPEQLRSTLREILRSKKAVHLLATFNPPRGGVPIFDMDLTFRDISEDIRPAENETRYFTITISEWRDPSSKRRTSAGGHSRKKGVKLPATHKLTADDTLSSLSKDYYGTATAWRHIRDANGVSKRFGQSAKLVSLPGRWKVGYKVKIPAIPRAESAL